MPSLETIADEDEEDLDNEDFDRFSNISSIAGPSSGVNPNSSIIAAGSDQAAKKFFSPMMREMKEAFKSQMTEVMQNEFKKVIEESFRSQWESSMLATVTKYGQETNKPPRRSRRMTSSPFGSHHRLVLDKSQDEDCTLEEEVEQSGANSNNASLEETIISGMMIQTYIYFVSSPVPSYVTGPTFATTREKMRRKGAAETATATAGGGKTGEFQIHIDPQEEERRDSTLTSETPLLRVRNTPKLADCTNQRRSIHLRKIEATASPNLNVEETATQDNKENAMRTTKTLRGKSRAALSVHEMATTLGINPGSPLLSFETPAHPVYRPKKSVRRTTMLQPELNATLSMNKDSSNNCLRRSKRLSVMQPAVPIMHALEEKQAWKVRNQIDHNDNMLRLLNNANVGMLQKLPGVGPKTAIILHSQR